MKQCLAVFVAAIGVSGCGGGGDAHAQGASAPVPALRAASGRIMGALVDVPGVGSDEIRVLQTINNRLTVIVIGGSSSSGERGIRGDLLYYASADCSGQPYSTMRGLVTNKLTARHAGRWYIADKDAIHGDFAYSSQSTNDDCQYTGSGTAVGSPAVELSAAQSAILDDYTGPFEAAFVNAAAIPGL